MSWSLFLGVCTYGGRSLLGRFPVHVHVCVLRFAICEKLAINNLQVAKAKAKAKAKTIALSKTRALYALAFVGMAWRSTAGCRTLSAVTHVEYWGHIYQAVIYCPMCVRVRRDELNIGHYFTRQLRSFACTYAYVRFYGYKWRVWAELTSSHNLLTKLTEYFANGHKILHCLSYIAFGHQNRLRLACICFDYVLYLPCVWWFDTNRQS